MLDDREVALLAEVDTDAAVDLCAELIAIPSVSGDERALAEALAARLRRAGMEPEIQDLGPGRANVVCTHGNFDGPALLLTGHIDTVPVGEGWTRNPFGAEVSEGRMYGRGSADMKAGLAAMVIALEALHRQFPEPGARVMFAGCADEEVAGLGTREAIRRGLRADWAVIGEPTELQAICAARGNSYYRFDVFGRSAHAGSPELGINAIVAASEAIARVSASGLELARGDRHPLLGHACATVSMIEGGFTVSAVPDRCTFWVDRRLLPGEDAHAGLRQLEAAVDRQLGQFPGLRIEARVEMELPPLHTSPEHELVHSLRRAIVDAGGPSLPPAGWTASCDGGLLERDAALPTVLFGPGSIVSDAHRPDESVALADIACAARAYALLGARVLSGCLPRVPAGGSPA